MIRRQLRRWFPTRQEHRCARCGAYLVERRRRPCPWCSSTHRIVARELVTVTHTADDMGAR